MLFVTCGVAVLPFELCDFDEITLTSGDGEKFKLYFDGDDYKLPEEVLGRPETFKPVCDYEDRKISINLNSDFISKEMTNEDILKQLAKKRLRMRGIE